MTSLKKENFNLKLRIYFLEEKSPMTINTPDGTESLFKQNIDLKVCIFIEPNRNVLLRSIKCCRFLFFL